MPSHLVNVNYLFSGCLKIKSHQWCTAIVSLNSGWLTVRFMFNAWWLILINSKSEMCEPKLKLNEYWSDFVCKSNQCVISCHRPHLSEKKRFHGKTAAKKFPCKMLQCFKTETYRVFVNWRNKGIHDYKTKQANRHTSWHVPLFFCSFPFYFFIINRLRESADDLLASTVRFNALTAAIKRATLWDTSYRNPAVTLMIRNRTTICQYIRCYAVHVLCALTPKNLHIVEAIFVSEQLANAQHGFTCVRSPRRPCAQVKSEFIICCACQLLSDGDCWRLIDIPVSTSARTNQMNFVEQLSNVCVLAKFISVQWAQFHETFAVSRQPAPLLLCFVWCFLVSWHFWCFVTPHVIETVASHSERCNCLLRFKGIISIERRKRYVQIGWP